MSASRVTIPEEVRILAEELAAAVEASRPALLRMFPTRWSDFCVRLTDIEHAVFNLDWRKVDVPKGFREGVTLLEQQRMTAGTAGDGWDIESQRALTLLTPFRPKKRLQPAEAVYLGQGRVRIGSDTIALPKQEEAVIEALVDLEAAGKTKLQEKSGYQDVGRVLRRIQKKYPTLAPLIILPGKANRGGYRTTIRRP